MKQIILYIIGKSLVSMMQCIRDNKIFGGKLEKSWKQTICNLFSSIDGNASDKIEIKPTTNS